LAVGAAEQILKQEVDRNKHKEIIDNLDKALGDK
jgi:F0F1-type ATP synthase membrane subunit b/b'